MVGSQEASVDSLRETDLEPAIAQFRESLPPLRIPEEIVVEQDDRARPRVTAPNLRDSAVRAGAPFLRGHHAERATEAATAHGEADALPEFRVDRVIQIARSDPNIFEPANEIPTSASDDCGGIDVEHSLRDWPAAFEDCAGVHAVEGFIKEATEVRVMPKLDAIPTLAVMPRDSHEREIRQLAIDLD